MDAQTEAFLQRVATQSPGLASVWLIGSRAKGTVTASSDYDFVAFGTEATLAFLREAKSLHRENTDFLVVTNGEDFQSAWGAVDKGGFLSKWEWKEVSEDHAEYMQSKWVEREDGSRIAITRGRAVKVWPRHANAL